jgi:hypothetical protein
MIRVPTGCWQDNGRYTADETNYQKMFYRYRRNEEVLRNAQCAYTRRRRKN